MRDASTERTWMSSSNEVASPAGAFGAQCSDRLVALPHGDADEAGLVALLQRAGSAEKARFGGNGRNDDRDARLDDASRDALAEPVPGALPLVVRQTHRLVEKDLRRPAVENGERRALKLHVSRESAEDRPHRRAQIRRLVQDTADLAEEREGGRRGVGTLHGGHSRGLGMVEEHSYVPAGSPGEQARWRVRED